MRIFDIVAAIDLNLGMGKAGKLPWRLPGDLSHFKEITMATVAQGKKNAVIMGRKTWESLPEKFRPLPGRLNIVLTRNNNFLLPAGVLRAESLDNALKLLDGSQWKGAIENVFVIGGGKVFAEALKSLQCHSIYLTQILSKFDCDVFFPGFKDEFKEVLSSPRIEEGSVEYYFAVYSRF